MNEWLIYLIPAGVIGSIVVCSLIGIKLIKLGEVQAENERYSNNAKVIDDAKKTLEEIRNLPSSDLDARFSEWVQKNRG